MIVQFVLDATVSTALANISTISHSYFCHFSGVKLRKKPECLQHRPFEIF